MCEQLSLPLRSIVSALFLRNSLLLIQIVDELDPPLRQRLSAARLKRQMQRLAQLLQDRELCCHRPAPLLRWLRRNIANNVFAVAVPAVVTLAER